MAPRSDPDRADPARRAETAARIEHVERRLASLEADLGAARSGMPIPAEHRPVPDSWMAWLRQRPASTRWCAGGGVLILAAILLAFS